MTAMSGATVPAQLQAAIDAAPDDDAIRAVGVRHCISQCAELLEARVPGLHFYTFNRARAPMEILAALHHRESDGISQHFLHHVGVAGRGNAITETIRAFTMDEVRALM